jgi:hypothetical protein
MGVSSTNKLVPFGIAITLGMDTEAYVNIFRMFFEAVKGRPKIIVSDEEKAIHSALVELRKSGEFTGLHLHDSFHILNNVHKKINPKQDIRYYSQIIHSKNLAELEKYTRMAK